jgi:hypothetical protein
MKLRKAMPGRVMGRGGISEELTEILRHGKVSLK